MKINLLTLLLFISLSGFSQNVEAPLIVTKIKSGDTLKNGNYSISFLEVTEDSRCPSDVTCIWEGRAKVKVHIENNGNTEEKEILFKGKSLGNEKEHIIFKTEKSMIIARQLTPYPVSSNSGKREYVLEVYERINSQKEE